MYVCALMYVRANVKLLHMFKYIYIYVYIYILYYLLLIYTVLYTYHNVWIRSMERILQTGMEPGYGTGVVPDLLPDPII